MTVRAKNKAYANILMNRLRGLSKRTMIRAVTTGYRVALSATFQDSGRAAYNWRLKIGAGEEFHSEDWYQAPRPASAGTLYYNSKTATRYAINTASPVGYQGEGRDSNAKARRKVIDYRMREVGLGNYAYTNPSTFDRTPLYDRLGGGRAGGVTKVTMYNPLYSPTHAAYVDNAFEKLGEKGGRRSVNVGNRIKAEVAKALAAERAAYKS